MKKKQTIFGGRYVINVPVEFTSHRELINFMRTKAGMTQGKLAKKIGTRQPAIARLEKTKQVPSLLTLLKIAKACGFNMEAPYFACKKCHKNISECNCKKA